MELKEKKLLKKLKSKKPKSKAVEETDDLKDELNVFQFINETLIKSNFLNILLIYI